MNATIDLFGRSIVGDATVVKGPPGVGFKLTEEQNFDLENKRITNAGDAINDSDLVTKKHVLILENKTINGKKRRLINLADPVDAEDAVTKWYMDREISNISLDALRDSIKTLNEISIELSKATLWLLAKADSRSKNFNRSRLVDLQNLLITQRTSQ